MKKHLFSFNVVLFICSVLLAYVSGDLSSSAQQAAEKLREKRIQLQGLQQSVAVLENDDFKDVVENLDSEINDIKINLAEYIAANNLQAGVSNVSYQLDYRNIKRLPQKKYPIRRFRLDLTFNATSAMVIVEFIQRTTDAVSPWPVEVRACDIDRLLAVSLWVHCVLDIHYWGRYD